MTKKIVMIMAVILVSSFSVYAADLKIGHLDVQRLVAESDVGKQAHEQYMARNKKYQDEINVRSDKLKALKEAIENGAKKLKKGDKVPQNLLDKDRDYAAQARELQRLLGSYQEELKVYDAELSRKVLDEFAPILNDYAKRNGYDYIFGRMDVFAFAAEKNDLTGILIKEFNNAVRASNFFPG